MARLARLGCVDRAIAEGRAMQRSAAVRGALRPHHWRDTIQPGLEHSMESIRSCGVLRWFRVPS